MASGCPVVACNAGGVPDAVEDGVTGFLYHPSDAQGLVKAVRRALDHPEECGSIRARARAEVERQSWQEATRQLRCCYVRAMEDRRPASAAERPVRRSFTKRTAMAVARRLLP